MLSMTSFMSLSTQFSLNTVVKSANAIRSRYVWVILQHLCPRFKGLAGHDRPDVHRSIRWNGLTGPRPHSFYHMKLVTLEKDNAGSSVGEMASICLPLNPS